MEKSSIVEETGTKKPSKQLFQGLKMVFVAEDLRISNQLITDFILFSSKFSAGYANISNRISLIYFDKTAQSDHT